MIDDLFFQCYRANLESKFNIKNYSLDLIFKAYSRNLTPEQFFDEFIYLPF